MHASECLFFSVSVFIQLTLAIIQLNTSFFTDSFFYKFLMIFNTWSVSPINFIT